MLAFQRRPKTRIQSPGAARLLHSQPDERPGDAAMRNILVLASVIVTGATASCEHGPDSWCEGDWVVDLVSECDGECDSLQKQMCWNGTCIEGDFGAECVLTTKEDCTPEAYYCDGNSWTRCGRSGHPQWRSDCVEWAQQYSSNSVHYGPSCLENLGTTQCVHAGLPCDPERSYDCVGDYLVRCGRTGFAIDFEICTYRTPPMRCVVEDRDAHCRK